ncbi:Clr5 domain-containing protein [Diaporthe eres]|nr:Clr5 domain-containing protein [Diaporthe eres]
MTSGRDDTGRVGQTAAIQDTNNLFTPGHDAYKRSQPVRYATEGDWAMHRTENQRLYMDEELPLKEVIHTMKEKHSFHATPTP